MTKSPNILVNKKKPTLGSNYNYNTVSMFYVTEKIVKVVQRKLLHSSNSAPNMNCRKSMDCICNEDRIQFCL